MGAEWAPLKEFAFHRPTHLLEALVESETLTSHGRPGRDGPGPRRAVRGWGGRGWAAQCGQCPTLSFRFAENRREPSWTTLRRQEHIKSHANRFGEHDGRLVSGLSARPDALFINRLLANGPAPFCFCKSFPCKAYPGIARSVAFHNFGYEGKYFACENLMQKRHLIY